MKCVNTITEIARKLHDILILYTSIKQKNMVRMSFIIGFITYDANLKLEIMVYWD